MTAAKEQAVGAHHLPELRDAEARAAAAFQRLTIARAQIEEEAGRTACPPGGDRQAARASSTPTSSARSAWCATTPRRWSGWPPRKSSLAVDEAGAGEREATARAAFEAASAALGGSEAALGALTAERAEAAAARQSAERALRDATERRDRLHRQLADIDREASEIASRIAGLPDPAEKRAEVEAATTALGEAEQAAVAAEKAVADARQREAGLRPPVQEAKADLARVETEARTLQKVLNAASGGLFPAVVEKLKVERGFETALGAALGEDLDAPLDRSAPAHWGDVAADPADAALPQGGAPAVRRRGRAAPAGPPPGAGRRRRRSRRLAPAGPAQARAAAGQPRGRPVALGRLYRLGRCADAGRPAAGPEEPAGRARRRRDFGDAPPARGRGGARRSRGVAYGRPARPRERRGKPGATPSTASARLATPCRAPKKRPATCPAAEPRSTRRRAALSEGHEEAAAALGEAEALVAAAPDLAELQARLDRLSTDVAGERAVLADARAAHEGLKREAAARAARLAAISSERQGWTARAENADRQITALAERRDEAQREKDALADAPDEIEVRRRALLSQLSEAERLRQAAADRLQDAENRQSTLDKAATAAIQALSESRETRVRAEERLTAADERRREIEARIQEALGTPPHLVVRQAELDPEKPLPDMGDVERRLERLKIERERLGAVNLRAEEEQRELSERLETLVTEREDVLEAIRKLRQAIHSLNREGRERLLAAFDVVNGHFQRLFTHLFGGGTAELQLIESEDPLEAGLEILARPPGKKPQTMTLLSGGEQALTAMALIFAVFLTNPAPICVLDEVDAPLDDHNVERFCNLMDEMAGTTETRFVIITHNPITMARMNRLFGVTMAEQGVSQLVSVDLEAAEKMREAG